jgi:hypothetical protein
LKSNLKVNTIPSFFLRLVVVARNLMEKATMTHSSRPISSTSIKRLLPQTVVPHLQLQGRRPAQLELTVMKMILTKIHRAGSTVVRSSSRTAAMLRATETNLRLVRKKTNRPNNLMGKWGELTMIAM